MTFKQGESGNPNGRPKGIVDKRTQLRALLQPHADDLIEKLVERAKLGDSWAMKLCIDRLIPPAKADQALIFDLPDGSLEAPDNMLKITNGITQAVASGLLTIEEAEKFAEFLDRQRTAIRDAEFKKNMVNIFFKFIINCLELCK